MKCKYYRVVSPKEPRMRCGHYHSGTEWLSFKTRDELRGWKERHCSGNHETCPYFKENIGRDTEFEDVWVVILRIEGRDYWCRVADAGLISVAIEKMIKPIEDRLAYREINRIPVRTKEQVTILVLHSADSSFEETLEELQFSGVRVGEDLEFWFS
ncbi:hypothetical protein RB620_24590 [Paenibacillus sp. LHD-117]|uniref:hypothetical protein n=1 Tax=Paenibacillus sp. LHD-117 TaxID=3071412 RepID=UPI0027E1DE4F|nr:hypothetical protein [Paenibacillus sp. LHD-117]MDQ6422615.1 hypothetical protein [Paenibacillus sp. LHD-117]